MTNIRTISLIYTSHFLAQEMLTTAAGPISQAYIDAKDPCMQIACERVALKFILCDSDLAEDLLSKEEVPRAIELYTRGQLESRLLQHLLRDFLILLQWTRGRHALDRLFTISIMDEFRKARVEDVKRRYGMLKKTMEQVASGVKSDCYYDAAVMSVLYTSITLDEPLNRILAERIGYDFNQAHDPRLFNDMSTLFCNQENTEVNRILQLALVHDAEFWREHENFHIPLFLNRILAYNGLRHAEKVLCFLADNLLNMPHMALVCENGFPLWMSQYDRLVKQLQKKAVRFTFGRLEAYCDVSAICDLPLICPMTEANETMLAVGQAVWARFIGTYNYPAQSETVTAYLTEEVRRFVRGETHENQDIAVILDASTFRYAADNQDRQLFAAYHPDCFSYEQIWNRVYMTAYAVTLLSSNDDTQCSYLQRIFVDLIKTIEKRMGICTAHQLDSTTRTKHYDELKTILHRYGVPVDDTHKSDYIISLLDRDTALIDEAERFPILEQIGDAIYGLAVAELLFYDPATERMREDFETYTRAEAQVLIAKKQGFDKLYLRTGLPAKYTEYESLFYDDNAMDEVFSQNKHREKYLADSLEMIIGSIYRDSGIEQALTFAKQLLIDTYPRRFHSEVHPTEENKKNRDIDADYWSKILPPPCSAMTHDLGTLRSALSKVVLIDSIGNDDKKKRKFITYSLGDEAMYGDENSCGVTWAFHDYLNNGLAFVLAKYGDTVREYYQNK